ncbi:MAG TPA: FliA/WhiG family RNA polymerase sigma factor [Syntrophorhabdaceae bacterium]|jgi:RNA polymerase sigma factor for flagellar operon FliA|nr:FliA/WhiG family RNA polymerase sigma factor [Syntrophorhabdaceae bacterium]HOT41939.1 FliA/WhiG family RNA polymerase sigma factor [Syntrophorhabdaceae bacterium]HPC67045.1 FliA/WhiG family RNA polymerase sigma factor [Syntrophorhabdaceae bacterium]HQE79872.1 FliA/WhiG family RNA polymerase sigma factor [Syntrophorhabdaceae bacterium]HQH42275.1 FliA/WhiG family RNA polymerase sigma factor [Syntrophorhabdaceae bacterium]
MSRLSGYGKTKESEKERVIEEYLPVIKHLAYKITKGFDDETTTEDLISAGIMGLLEAFDKYDPTKGAQLKTFAYLRIRGAMIDELRAKDWFSRNTRTKAKKIEETIRRLENRLGRHPFEEEIADELNLGMDDYLTLIKDYKNLSIISIEDIYESVGEDREKIMRYVMDEGQSPADFAEFKDIEDLLAREIDRLPEKQKLVLSLYYYEDLNMKEIAAVLDITEARVCQIHSQAILNLRATIKKQT